MNVGLSEDLPPLRFGGTGKGGIRIKIKIKIKIRAARLRLTSVFVRLPPPSDFGAASRRDGSARRLASAPSYGAARGGGSPGVQVVTS